MSILVVIVANGDVIASFQSVTSDLSGARKLFESSSQTLAKIIISITTVLYFIIINKKIISIKNIVIRLQLKKVTSP